MNTKNNRRRRDSIRRMEQAFIDLLQTRELNEITVSELCQRSGLNRSTFYANFVDLYDLADKIREHLEEEVGRLYEGEKGQGFSSDDFLKLFRHIRDNQLFYLTYFKLGYDGRHQVLLYDASQARRYFDDRYIDYHLAFFKSGFNAIVKMWLAGGCRETPEEINEIIQSEYRGRTQKSTV